MLQNDPGKIDMLLRLLHTWCQTSSHTANRFVGSEPSHFTLIFMDIVMQLTDVLRLDEEELPDEDRVHCLKVFTGLLSTQVSQPRGSRALPAFTTAHATVWLDKRSMIRCEPHRTIC